MQKIPDKKAVKNLQILKKKVSLCSKMFIKKLWYTEKECIHISQKHAIVDMFLPISSRCYRFQIWKTIKDIIVLLLICRSRLKTKPLTPVLYTSDDFATNIFYMSYVNSQQVVDLPSSAGHKDYIKNSSHDDYMIN